ncbi:hypothetical protein VAWG002_43510 (plasmid) [Aeromonas veronii]|nr:hypothetical protein VAWG002_43510 [Aeromonas veronii]
MPGERAWARTASNDAEEVCVFMLESVVKMGAANWPDLFNFTGVAFLFVEMLGHTFPYIKKMMTNLTVDKF